MRANAVSPIGFKISVKIIYKRSPIPDSGRQGETSLI